MFSEPAIRTRLRLLALTAGCLAVLGLAACGDDETTTMSSTSTETTGSEATQTTDGADGDSPDASAIRDQFNEQLLQVLTTTQDLSRAQAECAIEELQSTVSDEELQQAVNEAAETGQPPQDVVDAGFDAGALCADK